MNAPAKIDAAEIFLSRARAKSAALRFQAERGIPSAYRATKIANVIDEYLERDAEYIRVLSRPAQCMLGMYLTDYKYAIESILNEEPSEDYFTTPRVSHGMGGVA